MKRSQLILLSCIALAILIVLIIVVFNFVKMQTSSSSKMAAELIYEPDILKKPLLSFTLNFLKNLRAPGKFDNLIISPYSMSNGFAMLMLGAAGLSRTQIFNAFDWGKAVDTPVKVHPVYQQIIERQQSMLDNVNNTNGTIIISNSIFVDESIELNTNFVLNLNRFYKIRSEKLNFRMNAKLATEKLNDWVNQSSLGKIERLFDDPLEDRTLIVLLNVVYFSKFWSKKFETRLTAGGKFYVDEKTSIDVQYMFKRDKYFLSKNPSLKYDFIEIPYSDENLNCYIVLPEESVKLSDIIERLSIEDIDRSIEDLKEINLALTLPKFKLETSLDLKESMQNLEVTDIFDSRADLSEMSSNTKNLIVSKTIHKTVIEFSEEGTQGAAATGIAFEARSGSIVKPFKVNRPFLFLIRNSATGIIYFAGQVFRPLSAN